MNDEFTESKTVKDVGVWEREKGKGRDFRVKTTGCH